MIPSSGWPWYSATSPRRRKTSTNSATATRPTRWSKTRSTSRPTWPSTSRIAALENHFTHATPNRTDGLKLDFPDGWVHLRKSNTEPIVRVYAEAATAARARELAGEVKDYFLR